MSEGVADSRKKSGECGCCTIEDEALVNSLIQSDNRSLDATSQRRTVVIEYEPGRVIPLQKEVKLLP